MNKGIALSGTTMPPPRWGRDCTVSVTEMDNEHEELFNLASRLRKAIRENAAAPKTRALCKDLAEHVSEHFTHEKRLMRSIHYPLMEWHTKQHHTAETKLEGLKRSLARGDGKSALDQLDTIGCWLEDHIRLSDRMLSASVRNYRRAHAR